MLFCIFKENGLQVLSVDYVSANDDGSVTTNHNQTCWAASCFTSNGQAQSGYGLLMVIFIVLAAAVVLVVVRLLSG